MHGLKEFSRVQPMCGMFAPMIFGKEKTGSNEGPGELQGEKSRGETRSMFNIGAGQHLESDARH